METPKPDWTIWSAIQHAQLWELALLALDIEPRPEFVIVEPLEDPRFVVPESCPHFDAAGAGRMWKLAQSRRDELKYVTGSDELFTLVSFATMARRAGLQLPEQFPGSGAAKSPGRARWPWGDYTTPELDALAAAAHEWWADFDPADPASAPTNEEVANWLFKNHGVVRRTADAMASMLRHPSLPSGRRKGGDEKG